MHNRQKILAGLLATATVFLADTVVEKARAQKNNPRPQDKVTLGQEEVRQLVLLMDTNKNGKISREEFMKFMQAEFDRLDKDKSGELDVRELEQSQLRVSHPAVGK